MRLEAINSEFDFACLVRSNKNHLTNILGAFLIFNLNGNMKPFVTAWENEILKVLPRDRWRGFGQSVLWFTFESFKDKINVLNIADIKDAPFISKEYEDSEIWLNSNNKLTSIAKEHQSNVGRYISWVDLIMSNQRHNPINVKHHIQRHLLQIPSNRLITSFVEDEK